MNTPLDNNFSYLDIQNTAKNRYVLCLVFLCLSLFTNGQSFFDHSYNEINGYEAINPKGKSIIDENCDFIVTVNSIKNATGFFDFQISKIKSNDGAVHSSFSYGTNNGNEYCNSACKTIITPDHYILCGKSDNNNMLVMEVDGSGGIIWSKEIIFTTKTSEAISVLPIYDLAKRGYMVVGNTYSGANSEIAIAKLDVNGNLIFANEYMMNATYISNVVTDAAIIYDGGGIPGNTTGAERICMITGNQITATGIKFFITSITTFAGMPWFGSSTFQPTYEGSNVAGLNPQIISKPHFPINSSQAYDYVIAFAQSNSSFTTNTKLTTVFKANNGPFTPGIQWQYTFVPPPNVASLNTHDITQLNDNNLVILGSEHPAGGIYNPFTLHLSQNGSYLSENSYNVGAGVVFPFSITENCVGLVHNGANLTTGSDTKVTQDDINTPKSPCADIFEWDRIPANIIETPVNMTYVSTGTFAAYLVQMNQIEHKIFDCKGHQLALRPAKVVPTDVIGAINSNSSNPTNWFFPNPASSQLNLELTNEQETITIYNNLGKIVLVKNESGSISLDISELPQGIYIIERTNKLGKSVREKLIINYFFTKTVSTS